MGKGIITTQKLVKFNKRIGAGGNLINSSSLDFAINQKDDKKKVMASQLRALLTDHAFLNGNKRTSMFVVAQYMPIKNQTKMRSAILKIAQKNIKDLRKIDKVITNANK